MHGTRVTGRRRTASKWSMAVCGTAVALLVGVPLGGSANADWSPPRTVAPEIGVHTAIAVAPEGTATVAWTPVGSTGVYVRQFGPDGTPRGPQFELGNRPDISAVHAAAAADGSVLVAWSHGLSITTQKLEARWIDPTGEPEPMTHDLATNLQDSELAVAPDGRATIVWEDGSVEPGRIAMRQLLPGGTPTGKEFLSEPGETAGDPSVAVASAGEAAGTVSVAFIRIVEEGYVVQVRQVSPEGEIGATSHNLSPIPDSGNDSAYEPRIAVDEQGTATVAWQQTSSGSAWIRARRLLIDGTLGVPVDISGPGADFPAVGVAPGGDAVIGWGQLTEPEEFAARARELGASGELGDVLTLGPESGEGPADDRRWLEIAAPRDGRATLVWWLFDTESERPNVWSRDLADGKLGKRVELGANPSQFSRIGADDAGRVSAVWSHYDLDADQPMIQIARLLPGKPNLQANAKARKRVKRGAKLAVKVRVRNRGAAPVAKVRVCPKLPKKSKRAFKPLGGAKGCKQAGGIAAGKAKTVRLRLKAKRKLRPGARYKLGVIITGRDGQGARLPKRSAAVRVRGAR